MTLLPGPSYVTEPRVKGESPRWHRLPSTAWLLADVVLTVGVAFLFAIDGALPFWALLAAGIVAFAAAAGTIAAAVQEISHHRRPVASVMNMILSLLINPYAAAGYLVSVGVLDFG